MLKGLFKICFTLLSVFPFVCPAQERREIDSLLLVLHDPALADTSRVETLISLGGHYKNLNQYEQALAYANEAHLRSKNKHDNKRRMASLFLLIEINLTQRNFGQAYAVLYETLRLSISANDSSSIARSYFYLGRYYRLQTILPQSMEAYINALELYEALDDEIGQAMCFSNLGKFSSDLRDFETALSYFNQALAIFKRHSIMREVYISYQLLGDVYYRAGQYDKSMEYHKLALQGSVVVNDKLLESYAYDNIANVYVAQNDFERAKEYFEKSIKVCAEVNDAYGLASAYNDLAMMYLKLNDNVKVFEYGRLGLQHAEASANRGIIRDVNITLYEMYKQNQQWAKALDHLEVVLALNDSINNGEKTNLVNNIRFEYDRRKQLSQLEKKEAELKIQKAELEARRRLTYLYWAVGAMIISFLIMLWRRNVHKQRVNQALTERNEAIRNLNEGLENEVSQRTKELRGVVEALTQRNEDLEHFSYVLSHNVRAPIAQLKGLISILDKENIHGQLNHDVISRIEQASSNFDIIIHDLQNILSVQSKQHQREIVILKDEIELVLWGLGEDVEKSNATIIQKIGITEIHTVRSFM
ncbi:MAG: tetratricopeptide repeat protein, partial [Bacteroidota bacterium]